jgi:hypothetical protein
MMNDSAFFKPTERQSSLPKLLTLVQSQPEIDVVCPCREINQWIAIALLLENGSVPVMFIL